jgi:hypothetical protein
MNSKRSSMRYKDHAEFFNCTINYKISVKSNSIYEKEFTVEEMYRHFKARLLKEMIDEDFPGNRLGQ